MNRVLLLQLPIPQLNYGKQTGNIPMGAACLKQAAQDLAGVQVEILPESLVSYIGDAALLEVLKSRRPDILGFSVYCWNVRRSLYMAARVKEILHPPPRIVFGGPEITPDNPLVQSDAVDFRVCGEGEAVFRMLLQEAGAWRQRSAAGCSAALFEASPCPYTRDLLEPEIENLVLVESQRGCPFSCGYCYYSKARRRPVHKQADLVLQAVRWALEHGVAELFFLDPTLTARIRLQELLEAVQTINPGHAISLMSEIRAEQVTRPLADRFAAAGFRWFEIGLQSTNPEALRRMNRPTDLDRFLRGAGLLKERGITPAVDLIAGLPGDHLSGFRSSVDFVADRQLHDDVQVFPLSVLPGTAFRAERQALGLEFEVEPPYPVTTTPTFSAEDLLLAFDYAEVRFDACLYPMPDLDISWRRGNAIADRRVLLDGALWTAKLLLTRKRPPAELARLARRLTHPYQVFFFPPTAETAYAAEVLRILSRANPFVPLEVVFIEPPTPPPAARLLAAVNIRRPHYLDLEMRYLLPRPGNRSVLFTLVSSDRRPCFSGEMQRQVFHWKGPGLPSAADLADLGAALEGVVLDCNLPPETLHDWQDRFVPLASDSLQIGFADIDLQRRWRILAGAGDYWECAFRFEDPTGDRRG